MIAVVGHIERIVQRDGLYAALRLRNARTPHRFTGLFRFERDLLRNVCLFDRFDPEVRESGDTPVRDTYRGLIDHKAGVIEFGDVALPDAGVARLNSPVVSCCGVAINDVMGRQVGSLCHHDLRPCEERISDRRRLRAAAPGLLPHL